MKGMDLKRILCLGLESFRVHGFADTYFGKYKDKRRMFGCLSITIRGYLAGWNVAKHGALSNSTVETEHKELAKLAKDMKFMQIILTELA